MEEKKQQGIVALIWLVIATLLEFIAVIAWFIWKR